MTNYGTIPTSSSEGTNELISINATTAKLGIRPWKAMVRSLDLPSGFGNTIERMKTNLVYFRTNYMIILTLIMFLSFLFHPVPLSVYLWLLADVYLVLFFFHMLMILSSMLSVILLLCTDEDAAWINIIATLSIEAVIVAAHAYVRKTDDLSPDEEIPLSSGFSTARPWKEMLWSLNLPSGLHSTIRRIKTNLVYFRINYVIILMLILCFSFFFHQVSGSVLLNLVIDVWLLLYYFLRHPSTLHPLFSRIMIGLMIISVILLSFTDAAWINITSTLLIEAVVVAAHGSFRDTHGLFVDEELAQTTAGVLTSSSS